MVKIYKELRKKVIMKGLVKRCLDLWNSISEPSWSHEDEPSWENEEQIHQGVYSVPKTLKENGFYSIQLEAAEMYDLGNFEFIAHFILYDRREKIAIDVTSDVQPAPLLSETAPAEVLHSESVESLEQYLTGKSTPEYTTFPQGMKSFIARELNDSKYDSLRRKMVSIRDARKSLDLAVKDFREQTKSSKNGLLNPGSG